MADRLEHPAHLTVAAFLDHHLDERLGAAIRFKTIALPDAATRDYPGVTGMITLNESHDAVKPAVVLQVKDGKAVYVTTVAP